MPGHHDSPPLSPVRLPSMPIFRALLISAAALLSLPTQSIAETPLKPVKVMTVEHSGAGLTRTFFGRVSARQTVDLAFQVAGQMIEFPAIEIGRAHV